ncbi:MAG: dienelactone hydrolase family protein [Pseudomonadales bacterium]|jgi:dienelactone hydrolase|nr:dienelactone hydrolase family protein [Pseudomonadales bacterium]
MTLPAPWTRHSFSHGSWTRDLYRRGSGPAVIVIHEMPGLHPLVVRFADRVVDAGMTVFMPSLFGEPGRPVTPGYALKELVKGLCIRREFSVWATDRSSPIVDWLRGLARYAHGECGGRGVGAVGMCFTGGFALAMMTEPAVVAPVLSQPSQPLALGFGRRKRAAAIDASPAEIACARRRMENEDLKLLGLRFRGDPLVPDARFARLAREFGDRFEAHELDPADAARVPGSDLPPHSVLTLHLDDSDPEGPTRRVERRVIEFFRSATGAVPPDEG